MTSPDPLPRLLAPFLESPARAGVVTDFDGTLAPIVDDPGQARPVPGVVDLLHRLARRYGRVAVVSGRPVAFLAERLDLAAHAGEGEAGAGGEGEGGTGALVVSGLYGLERAVGATVDQHPEARPWEPAVEEAAAAAEREAPAGVRVERKGLSVVVHVREAPHHEAWARGWAEARAAATGLAMHPARLSYELRPPLAVDKGTVVAGLVEGLGAACFLGADVGDLPAFDALDRLAQATGAATLRIGVRSPEAPPELLDRADYQVDGPEGSLELLRRLLPEPGPPDG